MSSRYNLTLSEEGQSYRFTTDAGNQYTAWFTEFFLQNERGEEFKISSFGFDRLKVPEEPVIRFDPKVKSTIQHIISTFFAKNSEDAVLYICLPGDGLAKSRHITFDRWFNELGQQFIKYDSHVKYTEDDFYSSLILLANNPCKDILIDAFNYTLIYWMGE